MTGSVNGPHCQVQHKQTWAAGNVKGQVCVWKATQCTRDLFKWCHLVLSPVSHASAHTRPVLRRMQTTVGVFKQEYVKASQERKTSGKDQNDIVARSKERFTRAGKWREAQDKKRHVEGPTKEHVELSDRLEMDRRARNGNTALAPSINSVTRMLA